MYLKGGEHAMLRDGVLYCDEEGCHRRLEEAAIVLKNRYGIKTDLCLSHARHRIAVRIEQAKKRKKYTPIPKKVVAKPKAKASPTPPLIPTTPADLTTDEKVADLYGVKVAVVRKYLLATNILHCVKYNGDPTLYLLKDEVRKLTLLGAADVRKLEIIPRDVRVSLFGDPEMFNRLNQGVLD
jgi:hypothetical protein